MCYTVTNAVMLIVYVVFGDRVRVFGVGCYLSYQIDVFLYVLGEAVFRIQPVWRMSLELRGYSASRVRAVIPLGYEPQRGAVSA